MRPLDEKETTAVFEKLFKFVGPNLKHIVERPALDGPPEDASSTGSGNPGRYCFRLHKNRVYYASESLVRRATSVSRGRLVSFGTCIGKFTKGGSFRLTVQALDLLAAHARRKVWAKETSEKSLTSGSHVLRAGLSRISENVVSAEGVVVFSSADVPLAFGIAAKSAQDCRKMDPKGIVVLNQADLGEYLRSEDDL